MKVNFDSQVITNLDDTPVVMDNKPLTFKQAVCHALTLSMQGDEAKTGADKHKWYKLAKRINKGGEVEITVEDLTTIKERVARGFSPLVTGQVFDLIEGEPEK